MQLFSRKSTTYSWRYSSLSVAISDHHGRFFTSDGGIDVIAPTIGVLFRDFQMKRWFSMRRSTIDQIVQQEWFGAG